MHAQIGSSNIASRANNRTVSSHITMDNVSQFTTVQPFLDHCKARIKTKEKTCCKYFIIIFGNFIQCFSIFQLFCQRFLEQDMFSSLYCQLYCLPMHIIRKYNTHCLDICIFQHLFVIPVEPHTFKFRLQLFSANLIVFAQCNQFYLRQLPINLCMIRSHLSYPNNSCFNLSQRNSSSHFIVCYVVQCFFMSPIIDCTEPKRKTINFQVKWQTVPITFPVILPIKTGKGIYCQINSL